MLTNYDDFSPFSMNDVREMKDHIGFEDFVLGDVMEYDGKIIVLAYTYIFSLYKSIIAVNFNKSRNFMYEKKFGISQIGGYNRPFYLFKHNGTPAIIFTDNIKNTMPSELTKTPHFEDDRSCFNAVILDNDDPERIVAFRQDQKPKIKKVFSVTKTSGSKELIYLINVAREGFKLTSIK